MEIKKCNKCCEVKSIDLFSIRKNGRVNYACKECSNKKMRDYYIENKNRLDKKRIDKKEEFRLKSKKYYYENRDTAIQKQLEYYHNNKERVIFIRKQYTSTLEFKKRRNEKRRNRIKNDEEFRIRVNLKNRIYYALKGKSKSKKTLELLGCSLDFFKIYLEEKFTEGMSWDNYGIKGWHIDHIIPCDAFDLTKKEEQEKCFHYTNLQPLWAEDNIKKSNKY